MSDRCAKAVYLGGTLQPPVELGLTSKPLITKFSFVFKNKNAKLVIFFLIVITSYGKKCKVSEM